MSSMSFSLHRLLPSALLPTHTNLPFPIRPLHLFLFLIFLPLLAIPLILSGLTIFIFFVCEYVIPSQRHRIIRQSFALCRWFMGMQQHFVDVLGFRMSYMTNQPLEQNKHLPVVVFLHGFTATKETWAFMSWMLRRTHRCISIDMVGHGETTPLAAERYDVAAQVERVHQLLTTVLGADAKYHICGTSMGGHIAGVYAAFHASHVLSVGLMCPAGVEPSPDSNQSAFVMEFIETGSCFFNVNSAHDLEQFLWFACERLCWIPILSAGCMYADREWRDTHGTKDGLYRDMLRSLIYRHCDLQDLLPKITSPVHIQWGEHDRILDPSTIRVILHGLASSPQAHAHPPDVVLHKGVGHCLQVEAPWASCRAYQTFLASLNHSPLKRFKQ